MNTACVPIGWQATTLRCTDGIRPGGRVIRIETSPTKEGAGAASNSTAKDDATSKTSSAASCLSSTNLYGTADCQPSTG
jgi:hypothetical protein